MSIEQTTTLIPFNPGINNYVNIQNFYDKLPLLGQSQGGGHYGVQVENLLHKITGRKTTLLDSCTSALEIGIRMLNLMPGDEVLIPSFSFTSCANACLQNNLVPVFCEVDSNTLNIDPKSIIDSITPKTRALMVIHYAGVAADMNALQEICTSQNLILIEDNAHGFGGKYKNIDLGNFGDFSTYSFHGTKNFSAGEGGALNFKNESFINEVEIYKEKGTDRNKFLRNEVDKYTWRNLGSSRVLNEISALLLHSQLEYFAEIQSERRKLWKKLQEGLKIWANKTGTIIPIEKNEIIPAAHFFWILPINQQTSLNVRNSIHNAGISTASHYEPLHLTKFGRENGKVRSDLSFTESLSTRLFRIPLHNLVTEKNIDKVLEFLYACR